MSPTAIRTAAPAGSFEDDLDLSIVGLGVQYPAFHNGPEALETIARRHYPDSNIMNKVLSINRFTGIEKRGAVGDGDHPLVNQKDPPTIADLNDMFMKEGVRISVAACRKAIAEWGGEAGDITHMVSTTCTNSANPGYDHFVAKQLGLSKNTQKVLLHGIGCSGGLAAIRTAANMALGAKALKRPARILVLACEVSSVFVRSELESIHQNQEVRIGVCLFSDCASACIVSNDVGELEGERSGGFGSSNDSLYDILGWHHELIDDTAQDLGFDVDPLGWKVVLTPRVPELTSKATPRAFRSLLESVPATHTADGELPCASDFEWALHPGGSLILSGVQSALGLREEHLMASYQVYMAHGNSSSATIMSVLDQSRRNARDSKPEVCQDDTKPLNGQGVVAAAFGPGITLEMLMLRRRSTGTPAEDGLPVDFGMEVKQPGSVNGNGHEYGCRTAETNGAPVNGTNGTSTSGGIHSNGHGPRTNGLELEAEDVD